MFVGGGCCDMACTMENILKPKSYDRFKVERGFIPEVSINNQSRCVTHLVYLGVP